MELNQITTDILRIRAKSIFKMAMNGQFMQALKVIRVTIYNMETAHIKGMKPSQVNKYLAMLHSAALYANNRNCGMVMRLANGIYQELEVCSDCLEDLPPVVRSSIAFAF
jgi:hypothetical protein